MAVELELTPKQKRPKGEPCCEALVHPAVSAPEAARLAALARALSDPVRVQLVDVLQKHAGEVCVHPGQALPGLGPRGPQGPRPGRGARDA